MRTVPITEVEVIAGIVHVRPDIPMSEDFEHIYRTATGVRWDRTKRCLIPYEPGTLTCADWFKEIVAAVLSEYGIRLEITASTRWCRTAQDFREDVTSWTATWPPNNSLERTREG